MTTTSPELKYEYIYRVNRAIDYIRTHRADNLELDNIAKIACVSKYHFHRIFHSQTGETINGFVRRRRLELAFGKLGLEGDKSITEIALECGFSSSQNFAKAFKKYFDISPKFVKGKYHWYKMHGIGEQINGLSEKKDYPRTAYFSGPDNEIFTSVLKRIIEQKKSIKVNVVEMPPFHLAYIRIIGFEIKKFKSAARELYQWADTRGLLNENSKRIGVFNSDPMVTPLEKFSYDMCVTIPENIEKNEKINIRDIPGGKCAVYHCELDMHDAKDNSPASMSEEWLRFFIAWLKLSGYHPDARPAYEVYYNDYETHPHKLMILDLCLPIKPA